jgi:hypothetical protein
MDTVEILCREIQVMADFYGFGTSESRAILTALEHAKIKAGLINFNTVACTCLSELEDDAYERGGPMSGKRRPPPCQATTHRR